MPFAWKTPGCAGQVGTVIVNYSDSPVICGRVPEAAKREADRSAAVTAGREEDALHACRGGAVGVPPVTGRTQLHPSLGAAYVGTRVRLNISPRSEAVDGLMPATEVVEGPNRAMLGWASPSSAAGDAHALKRLLQWLGTRPDTESGNSVRRARRVGRGNLVKVETEEPAQKRKPLVNGYSLNPR